jgi:hypothetical protein
MKKLALVFALLCFSSSFFAQEVLVLTKKKNGKEKTISLNNKIKLRTNSGEEFKGLFTLHEDSLTIVDEGTISLQDIEMISCKSTGVKIAGGSLAGFGGFAIIGLSISIVQALSDGALGTTLLVILIPTEIVAILITTAGVVMLTRGKKFKKDKWNYSIKEMEILDE